jgi:hypothetical protein
MDKYHRDEEGGYIELTRHALPCWIGTQVVASILVITTKSDILTSARYGSPSSCHTRTASDIAPMKLEEFETARLYDYHIGLLLPPASHHEL